MQSSSHDKLSFIPSTCESQEKNNPLNTSIYTHHNRLKQRKTKQSTKMEKQTFEIKNQTRRKKSIKKHEEERNWPRKNKVTLEGYIEDNNSSINGGSDQDSESGCTSVGRTKSLTDEDLDELKGCLDLGFGFNYDEIPELCNTLPALELCYSMTQKYLDDQTHKSFDSTTDDSSTTSLNSPLQVANWKISSPGDDPNEVKARLKYWAQAVACTVRLCNSDFK